MKIRSHFKAPIRQLGKDVEGYVLDEIDGKVLPQSEVKCVLSQRGFANLLGLKGGGGAVLTSLNSLDRKGSGFQLPRKIREKIDNRINFNYLATGFQNQESEGIAVNGYETETVIEVMKFFLEAERRGILSANQIFLAEKARVLLISLANTTLDTLIFQESGFWDVAEGQKVAQILDKYLETYARKWVKTFPDKFWTKLIKMKGYPSYMAVKRPQFVGHWVNDIVYDRLAPGIRVKLKQINPPNPKGVRQSKNHSFLTEDHGIPELKELLIGVMVLMDASANKDIFERMLNRAFPKFGTTKEMFDK